MTLRTLEVLVQSKFLVKKSSISTFFQGEVFIADHNLAPGIFPHLVQETLLEMIMRPSKHGSGSLAFHSSITSLHHPLGFNLRKKHSVVLFNNPLGKLLVHFIYEISDLLTDSPCCSLHHVMFPVSYFLVLRPLALQLIQDMAQSVNSSNIIPSSFNSHSQRRITC